ncbi:MAG: hypothetical protein SNJ68_05405 [Cyanobacteriota bacterium]
MKKSRLVLVHGVLADGTQADVAVDPVGGVITAVGSVEILPGDEQVECSGMVILPAAAEPHAHLDKALSSRLVPAMPVDLAAAVADWHRIWPTLTHEDVDCLWIYLRIKLWIPTFSIYRKWCGWFRNTA